MTIYFEYEKGQVLQALRYHFISRPEIRIMIILVNVFALASLVLYAMKKITYHKQRFRSEKLQLCNQPLQIFFKNLLWHSNTRLSEVSGFSKMKI